MATKITRAVNEIMGKIEYPQMYHLICPHGLKHTKLRHDLLTAAAGGAGHNGASTFDSSTCSGGAADESISLRNSTDSAAVAGSGAAGARTDDACRGSVAVADGVSDDLVHGLVLCSQTAHCFLLHSKNTIMRIET